MSTRMMYHYIHTYIHTQQFSCMSDLCGAHFVLPQYLTIVGAVLHLISPSAISYTSQACIYSTTGIIVVTNAAI